MSRRYGVDGCRAGWFYFWINGRVFGHGVVDELSAVVSQGYADVILVDMPIGLPDDDGNRDCDTAARRLLGRRASSVFPAPCRAALAAATYEEACALNEQQTGRRLSRQCWNIVPKIREVDRLLLAGGRARGRVRESHPEVCFAALNGGRPMAAAKRTADGYQERLAVLRAKWPSAPRAAEAALAAYRRGDVGRDDILDAMVLAVTASLPAARRETIPARPRKDDKGLPMSMVLAKMNGTNGRSASGMAKIKTKVKIYKSPIKN